MDLSLKVQRGECVALVGANGVGKSTLLRLLANLERPDSGRILLHGEDIFAVPERLPYVRTRIGMVFQEINIFPHLSVIDNVMLGPLRILGTPFDQAKAEATRLLRMVGLGELLNAMPANLSGGQKQRVEIARCLAMAPEVILFDEATSALDPTMKSEVLSVIRELARLLSTAGK